MTSQSDGFDASITMGVFYRSLPLVVADEKGFYAEYGLRVDHQQVTSSVQQFDDLRAGRYDCVQTSPDNVANYRFNAGNPLGERIEAQAFMGLDNGMYLVLAARKGIDAVEALRGKTLAVDAPASGFAYVLYKLMRRHGLERGTDYEVVSTGGVADRYQRLLAGEFDATLLSGGFETRAKAQGFSLLDSVADIADPYLGVVGAATERWLQEKRDVAVRLVRALLAATGWVLDPANRDEAVGFLQRMPNTDRALAEELFNIQLRPGTGIVADAGIDAEGLRNVLALRKEFGGFEDDVDVAALAGPGSGLYDLSHREAARQAR